MRVSPSLIEMGHKIRPIIHVWGRWCTRCQFVKLLVAPLGCITNHQSESPSDLSFRVRQILNSKVILALSNEVPGFCSGFSCECLWGLHLGRTWYRWSRWWSYGLGCLGSQNSNKISICGGIHIEIMLTKYFQCICGSNSRCLICSSCRNILGCCHEPVLWVGNSKERGHHGYELDNVVAKCTNFHNGGVINTIVQWYWNWVEDRNQNLESGHFKRLLV